MLERFDASLNFRPRHAEFATLPFHFVSPLMSRHQTHLERAVSFHQRGEFAQARQLYEQVLQALPFDFNALHLLGVLEIQTGNPAMAVELIGRAIDINGQDAAAHYNLGKALRELGQLSAALESYDQAVRFDSRNADAWYNRGNVLRDLGKHQGAIDSFSHAVRLKPDHAAAFNNRGDAQRELGQYQAALESYDKALALRPSYEFLFGMRLHTQMHICDWRELDGQIKVLAEKIRRDEQASTPFSTLAMIDSLPLQRKVAETWTKAKYPSYRAISDLPRHPQHEKLRIAYCSADFREHPVSFLAAELFEKHDREKFEIIALSYGPDSTGPMRRRLESAFDKFIDVRELSNRDIAELAGRLQLDIAIDLGGYTKDCRTELFMNRLAPIQVSYLGYLGTMGAGFVDYLFADSVIVPESSRQYYAEKIAYLPSYQVNDSQRKISEKIFSRAELGLPDDGFVFCCFNNAFKITPGTFAGWMRILAKVERSVLLLLADNELVATNLRREAGTHGIDENRLVFGMRLPFPEYLARYRTADLFLDTLPYNAGTTASDALWAGLPVLTCAGESFAGRVAASLMFAVGLPELVAMSQMEYEAMAIELATNPGKLTLLRGRLAENRLSTALFDTTLHVKKIELAYVSMYERYQANLQPDNIFIA